MSEPTIDELVDELRDAIDELERSRPTPEPDSPEGRLLRNVRAALADWYESGPQP